MPRAFFKNHALHARDELMGPGVASKVFPVEEVRLDSHCPTWMMDSAQQPTPDDPRELSRKIRDARRRVVARPVAAESVDVRISDVGRDELLAAIEELRAANRIKDDLLLSERMAREEAEAANRAKSDVLALLSHEFRTPLQAIFGYIELLEREIHGPLTDAQRRDLQRIAQSQQHLLGLITAMADFPTPERGHPYESRFSPTL